MDFHSLVYYISNYKNVLKTNGYYYNNETMKYVYFMQIPSFYANWDQVVFFTVNGKKILPPWTSKFKHAVEAVCLSA